MSERNPPEFARFLWEHAIANGLMEMLEVDEVAKLITNLIASNEREGLEETSTADVDVLLGWANTTRGMEAVLQNVITGRFHVTIKDGEPTFVLSAGAKEEAKELAKRMGLPKLPEAPPKKNASPLQPNADLPASQDVCAICGTLISTGCKHTRLSDD